MYKKVKSKIASITTNIQTSERVTSMQCSANTPLNVRAYELTGIHEKANITTITLTISDALFLAYFDA